MSIKRKSAAADDFKLMFLGDFKNKVDTFYRILLEELEGDLFQVEDLLMNIIDSLGNRLLEGRQYALYVMCYCESENVQLKILETYRKKINELNIANIAVLAIHGSEATQLELIKILGDNMDSTMKKALRENGTQEVQDKLNKL